MAKNALTEADRDVAQFVHDKQAANLAKKLGSSASSLYHAEAVSLLIKQGLLDPVKQAANSHANDTHKQVDHDKQAKDHDPAKKDRADPVPMLQDKVSAKEADAARSAISDGEHHHKELESGAKDGKATAGQSDKNIRVALYENSVTAGQRVYLERFLYEIKLAGKLGVLKSIDDDMERAVIGQALGAAELDGLISGSEVVATGRPTTPTTLDSMIGMAASVGGATVHDAQHRLKNAEEKIHSLEEQLHLALQEITPVIADENKLDDVGSVDSQKIKKFIDTYRSSPEYKAAEFELSQARGALGVEFHAHEDDLAAHAADKNNPGQAKAAHDMILDTQSSFAASDQPRLATDWIKQHRADPTYASAGDKKRIGQIADLAQSTAANIAMRDLKKIFEAEGPEGDKLDRAREYIQTHIVEPYGDFDTLKGLHSIPELLKQQKAVLEMRGAKDLAAATEVAKKFIEAGKGEATLAARINTGLGTLILGFAAGSGAASKGLASGADIHNFYSKAAELRELMRKGQKVEESAHAAELAKSVRGSFMKVSRGIGALALVGDAYALNDDWNHLDGSPAMAGKLAGDLVTAAGDAMTLVPGLEPVGEAISIVGTAISLIASAFIGDPVGDSRREATRRTLVDGGLLDSNTAKTVTNDDAAGNLKYAQTLQGNAALDTEQLQQLASTHDALFKDSKMMETAFAVWKYYSANKPEQIVELQAPYKDSLFAFLKGTDNGKLKDALIYARSCVSHGSYDARSNDYGFAVRNAIEDSLPKAAFKKV